MADYFTSTLYFYGDQSNLQALKDVLEKVIEKTDKDVYQEEFVLKECGLSMENCNEHGIVFTEIPTIEETMLLVKADTKWGPKDFFFDVIANHFGLTYASSSINGSEWYIHNDLEAVSFPENVLIDIWGNKEIEASYEYYKSSSEAISFLTKKFGAVVSCPTDENTDDNLRLWHTYLQENEIGFITYAIRD